MSAAHLADRRDKLPAPAHSRIVPPSPIPSDDGHRDVNKCLGNSVGCEYFSAGESFASLYAAHPIAVALEHRDHGIAAREMTGANRDED